MILFVTKRQRQPDADKPAKRARQVTNQKDKTRGDTHGTARHDTRGQDKTRQDKYRTRQDKYRARQDKTRQDKIRQDKDKTRRAS